MRRRDRVEVRDKAVAVLQSERTGRPVTVDKESGQVRRWAALRPSFLLYLHPMFREFCRLAQEAPRLEGDALEGFRGREDCPRVLNEFGPPPLKHRRPGRYNGRWRAVLYLANSVEAVRAEGAGKYRLVHSCRLPIRELKIADFTHRDLPNLVRAAFREAEIQDEHRPFGRVLAGLTRSAGFDGMAVPGVKGHREFQYTNVVIFRPEGRWRHWFAGGHIQVIDSPRS